MVVDFGYPYRGIMEGIIRGHQIGQFSGDADNEMMKNG
tara:strand:- start:525 stop:638 length:114 start_codon:yes stop_codon:yes gene_type:complete